MRDARRESVIDQHVWRQHAARDIRRRERDRRVEAQLYRNWMLHHLWAGLASAVACIALVLAVAAARR